MAVTGLVGVLRVSIFKKCKGMIEKQHKAIVFLFKFLGKINLSHKTLPKSNISVMLTLKKIFYFFVKSTRIVEVSDKLKTVHSFLWQSVSKAHKN